MTELEELQELVARYRELYENQSKYVEWLEVEMRKLVHWQKVIIGLQEDVPDSLVHDLLEETADEEFSRFCKENGINWKGGI